MARIILKHVVSGPLAPHDQSILNTLVYSALCRADIFSILSKIGSVQRELALEDALHWALTHDLVADEQG